MVICYFWLVTVTNFYVKSTDHFLQYTMHMVIEPNKQGSNLFRPCCDPTLFGIQDTLGQSISK